MLILHGQNTFSLSLVMEKLQQFVLESQEVVSPQCSPCAYNQLYCHSTATNDGFICLHDYQSI